MGVINYQIVQGWESPKGNPIDSDLFYDDAGISMEFSNANGERTYNAVSPEAITAGITAAGQIGGAIAGRGKSDIKQSCGRRPLLAKNRKAYDACVIKFNSTPKSGTSPKPTPAPAPIPTPSTAPAKKDNTMLYVGIGVGVLVLAGIAYKMTR